MTLKNYDVKEVTIAAGAVPIDAGFADGVVLKIERGPIFKTKIGVDGQMVRYKTNDRSARITVRLMQTSDSNAVFSALALLDKTLPNGAGLFPFLVKDRQGTSKYNAARCWVAQEPEVEFAGEPGIREWKLETDDMDSFDGGN